MKREYTVIVEEGEDGYLIATVPALPGCFTQAKTLGELLERTKEAIELMLEDMGSADAPPEARFLGLHRIAV
ncbi:MAG: hypothetical protein C0506_05350 [Anaerolinea sp.]|nr:hypothetical protein [Anaerolinea sp.]